MRELEAKLRVPCDAEEVVTRLEALGLRFSSATRQVDSVFAVSADVVRQPSPGTTVARLREESGVATLTAKQRRASALDRDEFEIRIDDVCAGKKILEALGQQPIVTVRKSRRVARDNDSLSVAVDDVDTLGTFIEVEVVADETAGASVAVENAIARISSAMRADVQRVEAGYDRLLLESV